MTYATTKTARKGLSEAFDLLELARGARPEDEKAIKQARQRVDKALQFLNVNRLSSEPCPGHASPFEYPGIPERMRRQYELEAMMAGYSYRQFLHILLERGLAASRFGRLQEIDEHERRIQAAVPLI